MTTDDCAHEKLMSLDALRAQCVRCAQVLTIGDGICPRCRRPLDDTPHVGAVACK